MTYQSDARFGGSKITETTLKNDIANVQRLQRIGEPTAALAAADPILRQLKSRGDQHDLATLQAEMAMAMVRLGRSGEALDLILNANRIWAERADEFHLVAGRSIYASILVDLGLGDEADAEATAALELARKHDNKDALIRALDMQAVIWVIAERFDLAISLLREATAAQAGDKQCTFAALLPLHIGIAISRGADLLREQSGTIDTKAYREAARYTEQAVDAAKLNEDRRTHKVALCNLAELYAILGDTTLAAKRLADWNDVPGERVSAHLLHYQYAKSDYHLHVGEPELALDVAREGLRIAESATGTDNLLSVTRRVVDAYEALGDYKAALEHHKRLHILFKKTVAEKAQWRAQIAEITQENAKVRRLLDLANRRASRLAEEALRDPLTGLANRRAFDRELAHLDHDGRASYALAILDLDHFKQINDTFSHLVGDDVLRMVSDVMKKNCRQEDLVARMGGEEFVVLMPDMPQETALRVCERIRKAISTAGWSALAENLKVSVSIGMALSEEGTNPLDVFALADARLYTAKADGRDRVEWRALGGSIDAIMH